MKTPTHTGEVDLDKNMETINDIKNPQPWKPSLSDVVVCRFTDKFILNIGLESYPEMSINTLKLHDGRMSAYGKCYLATYEDEGYKTAFNEYMIEQDEYLELMDRFDYGKVNTLEDLTQLRQLRVKGRIVYSYLNEDLFEDDFAAE